MTDQATTLRTIAATKLAVQTQLIGDTKLEVNRAFTIAVTGGKGGVGKSNVAVNLAIELADLGWRVSLLDADLAMANADLLCGVHPKFHLGHVLSGQRSLKEISIELSQGVRLIPAGSGIEGLANLSRAQRDRFLAELAAIESESDFLLIDTPAGIGVNVTSILERVAQIILVTTPDPTAVVDAYATIKVLHSHSPGTPVSVVVNNVVGIGDADKTFAQIDLAVRRFLQHPMEHLGTIPRDAELAEAVRRQIPVVDYAPRAPASRSLRLIAKRLDQSRRKASGPSKTKRPVWRVLVNSESR